MLRLRQMSVSLFTAAMLATTTAQATADTITVVDLLEEGSATVVAEFNSRTNTFTFTTTNTSAISFPTSIATITGIGFDLPPVGNAQPSGLNGFTGMQAPSLSSSFTFSDASLGAVPLFPSAVLDFGFLTGSSFATGDVDLGLAPGESGSFVVTGAAFTGFTEAQIANAIFLRFEQPGAAVPEPAAATLLTLALVGLRVTRLRRRTERD